MKLWQMLLRIDADVNLTDGPALFSWFAGRIVARDGALDMAEAEEATYAMALADQLVGVFASTPGYQAPGTRTYQGMNIVLAGTPAAPHIFKWLFDSANIRYGTTWAVVAAQPFEPELTGEVTIDDDGNEIPVRAIVPYRAVPQSIRPWLARQADEQGIEIQDDPELTPASIGGIMGAADWVVEGGN